MAPRKRKAAAEEKEPEPAPARVTRRSARRAAESNSTGAAVAESPAKKKIKAKAEMKEAKPRKVAFENGNGASEIVDDELVKKKSPRKTNAKKKTTTVVIEHCTQCRQFRRRAEEAKAGLEAGVSGIAVLFNPEKPRRGCFEIRAEGGEKFITLLDLKRPFKPMRDLDMEKVVADIVNKIK